MGTKEWMRDTGLIPQGGGQRISFHNQLFTQWKHFHD
jgi:hypothetical protein